MKGIDTFPVYTRDQTTLFSKRFLKSLNVKLPTRRLEQSEIFCEIRKQHDFLNLRLNLVWSGKKLTLNVPAHQIIFFRWRLKGSPLEAEWALNR
jgi:hypothetical protein